MKKIIHAFDFDGTITTRDTFLLFLRFVAGKRRFLRGLIRCSPVIVAWKLRVIPTQKAKEAVFARFCAGMPLSDFDALCDQFAEQNARLLRPLAVRAISDAVSKNEAVLIVSASIENCIAPFFADFGAQIAIEATKVETDSGGFLTGRFSGANCKGKEKVRRILERFPDRASYTLVAYGDSAGDREMLAFADTARYKPFRTESKAESGGIFEKLRFLFVGAIAVLVQYGAYRALLHAVSTTAAYTTAYIISLAVNFVLSTLFTFRVKPSVRRAVGFLLSHAVNYTMQIALLALFTKIGMSKNAAPIPVYAVSVPVNFLLVRFFLKGRPPPPIDKTEQNDYT